MRMLSAKKLLVSTIIFLFSNYTVPAVCASPSEFSAPKTQDEQVTSQTVPYVKLGVPRVVELSHSSLKQSFAVIRNVDYHHSILRDLQNIPFQMRNFVTTIPGPYGETQGGFLNVVASDFESGLVHIQVPQNMLEKNLKDLLSQPNRFNVRADIINPQLSPKIIYDSSSGSSLFLIEPWDFRLIKNPQYTNQVLDKLFVNVFSAFKAYAETHKLIHPQLPVAIHTSFWGQEYQHNLKMTTSIQLIAAAIAGIDSLFFHVRVTDPSPTLLQDAFSFVQEVNFKNLGAISQMLLEKAQEPSWKPSVDVSNNFTI